MADRGEREGRGRVGERESWIEGREGRERGEVELEGGRVGERERELSAGAVTFASVITTIAYQIRRQSLISYLFVYLVYLPSPAG